MDSPRSNSQKIQFPDLSWVGTSLLAIFIISLVALLSSGLRRVTFYPSLSFCILTLLVTLYNFALGKRKTFSIVILTIWVVTSIFMLLLVVLLGVGSGHPVNLSL